MMKKKCIYKDLSVYLSHIWPTLVLGYILPDECEGVPTHRIHHHPTHHKQASCLLVKHKRVVGKQHQVSTSLVNKKCPFLLTHKWPEFVQVHSSHDVASLDAPWIFV